MILSELTSKQKKNLLLTLVALLLLAGLIWWWHSPDPAETLRKRFSFFEVINASLRSKSSNSSLPNNLKEQMPDSPPELEPPTLLSAGEFSGLAGNRPAAGKVQLFRLGTGEYLLRLEDLSVVRGPGLHLYFTASAGPRDVTVIQSDFIDLGELRAQSGDLNYVIPADIDLREYHGVVVFSPYFRELYATASLATASASNP